MKNLESVFNEKDFERLNHFMECEAFSTDYLYTTPEKYNNDWIMFILLSRTPLTITEFLQLVWGQIDCPKLKIYRRNSKGNLKYPKSKAKFYRIMDDVGANLLTYRWDVLGDLHKGERIGSCKVWRGSRSTLFRTVKKIAKASYLPNWELWTPYLLSQANQNEFYKNGELNKKILFHRKLAKDFRNGLKGCTYIEYYGQDEEPELARENMERRSFTL